MSNPNKLQDFKRILEAYKINESYLEYTGKVSNEILLANYQANKPVAMSIGWQDHDICIILYKNKLIISDRDAPEADAYTSIYEIPDRTRVNLEYISKLRTTEDHKKEGGEIMANVASLFNGSPGSNILPKAQFTLDSKEQQHGTCTYVNIKSAQQALLFMFEYERLQQNKSLSEEEKIKSAREYARMNYKDMTKHMRNQATQELVESLNPKTQNSAVRDKEIAFQLLKLEIMSHHGQQKLTIQDRSEKQKTELIRLIYILTHLTPEYKKRLFSEMPSEWAEILKIAQAEKNEELVQLIQKQYQEDKKIDAKASQIQTKAAEPLPQPMVNFYKTTVAKQQEKTQKSEGQKPSDKNEKDKSKPIK